LDDAVIASLDYIAASVSGESGDGRNALAIANLSAQRVMGGGQLTFAGFFESLTGKVGLHSQEARSFTEAEEVLLLDLENRRMETSGVSLDEEMSYLLSFQHAYEAMIRVSGAIDEMTVDLISSFGR
jgi:flagellar hook-associated protein 1 FlgK